MERPTEKITEDNENNSDEEREEISDLDDQQQKSGEEVEGCNDMNDEASSSCNNEGTKTRVQQQCEEVQPSATALESVSDKEYDELCDAVRRRAGNDRHTPDVEEDAETDEEELHDVDQHQQQTDNIHSDLVTPELSAEEKESVPKPPKLSHKKSYRKRSPKADHQKKSGRKLEYKSPGQAAMKRKLLPKSNTKPKKRRKCIHKKKKLQERTIQQVGTWVQCMHSDCLKWRYLRDITDPSLIPEYWVCEQNTDPEHNSCDHPEEDYHSLKFVFTKFAEASIVWAKMQGYPWWPAMIEEDPDTGTYLEEGDTEAYPTHYHIVFLDKAVSRTWLKTTSIRKYDKGDATQTEGKGRDFKQQVGQAVARANEALTMSVQERIQTFGFSHTFKGKIVDDSQQSTQDENANPYSDQDQDEEDEEEEVDVEGLDLEALGLDVDEILEQAEALLSEGGETILSLQDTSQSHEPRKKSKRGRKLKESPSADEFQGKTDSRGKKKRKHKEKSSNDGCDKSAEKKKGRKHKSHHHQHHHFSKKESKEKEDGTTAESKDDTIKNENRSVDKMAEDLTEAGSKARKAQLSAEDCSAKKIKKPRSKKTAILNRDEVQKTQEDDNAPPAKKSAADAKPKKVRKARVKKADDDTEPQIKKPRAKKAAAVKPKTSNKTTAEDSEKLADKASDIPTYQKQVSKPKGKKINKKDEAVLKMKPSFKPPSKSTKDTTKKTKKSSFTTPVMMKDDVNCEKEKQEVTTKDTANDHCQSGFVVIPLPEKGKSCNQEKVADNGGTPPKKQKTIKSDTTANKTGKGDASKTKGKAKFSIKKIICSSSPKSAKSVPSEEVSKTDACINAVPRKNTDPAISSNKPKRKDWKPDGKRIKKAAPKRFSIKRKPSTTLEKGTPLNLEIDDRNGITQSQPKKMKSDHKEKMEPQDPGIDHDDNELLLDLDQGPFVDDVTMAAKIGGDGIDMGEESDDFSMEDLEDWPKDLDMSDEVKQEGPNKLNELAASNDASSQPFEVVEE